MTPGNAPGPVRSSAIDRNTRPRALLGLLVFLPKAAVTFLLALAVADMLVGVFLRYVMVQITDLLDLDPVNFFWVEEVGELSLTWLTMIGAAVGIADGVHFTLRVVTHHLPLRLQRKGVCNSEWRGNTWLIQSPRSPCSMVE